MKILALLLLLTLPTLQQYITNTAPFGTTILGYSDFDYTVSSAHSTTPPPSMATITPPTLTFPWPIDGPPKPNSVVDLLGPQLCFVPFRWITYTHRYKTHCPDDGLWIKVSSYGVVWIRVNGVLLNIPTLGHFTTPDRTEEYWVFIPGKYLKCGCNVL